MPFTPFWLRNSGGKDNRGNNTFDFSIQVAKTDFEITFARRLYFIIQSVNQEATAKLVHRSKNNQTYVQTTPVRTTIPVPH